MNIYSILSSIQHNSHFLKRYIWFIKKYQLDKNTFGTELHHICPKAIFPEFRLLTEFKWNAAVLSPRAHYIAHRLLYKTFPYSIEMKYAFFCMSNGFTSSDQARNYKITSKVHETIRLEISSIRRKAWQENNPGKAQKVKDTIIERHDGLGFSSENIRTKYTKTMIERYGVDNFFKCPHFIEVNKVLTSNRWANNAYKKSMILNIKQSLSSINRSGEYNSFYGKNHSDETKRKISERKKGTSISKYSCINCKLTLGINNYTQHNKSCKGPKINSVTCPHCNKIGKPGSNMNRWHFENCKFKK